MMPAHFRKWSASHEGKGMDSDGRIPLRAASEAVRTRLGIPAPQSRLSQRMGHGSAVGAIPSTLGAAISQLTLRLMRELRVQVG